MRTRSHDCPYCHLGATACRSLHILRYEFAAGKNLLSGEYVLPSGVALPFGAMIAKLKRDRLVADLMEVRRRGWCCCTTVVLLPEPGMT